MKYGAGLGAVESAARSDDLLSEEGVKDVALGTSLGALGGVGGELIGRGLQKAGKTLKKGSDILPDPTDVRESAIHKTPTQRRKENLSPNEKVKNREAIKIGEKEGIFEGADADELVPRTQARISEIGEQLGSTSKILDEGLDGDVLRGPAIKYADEALQSAKQSIADKVRTGVMDLSSGKKAAKIYGEEINRLQGMLNEGESPLQAIRTLKTNIYNRLNNADFQFGGPKAGTPKDTLKDVTKALRDMEQGVLDYADQITKIKDTSARGGAEKVSEAVSKHREGLKTFGGLKRLEEQLANTVDKQVGRLGLKEITAGSVGAQVDPHVGLLTGALQALNKKLDTPRGKFYVAKILDAMKNNPSKAQQYIDGAAKILGVSVEDLGKFIRQQKAVTVGTAIKDKEK
jgi:hypothetical protein